MELNLAIVSDHLPKNFKTEKFGFVHGDCRLKYPVIYESGSLFSKELLYIAMGDTLPQAPPKSGLSVVCVGDHPPSPWTQGDCQVLWISDFSSLFLLYNDINAIFAEFNSWERDIITEITKITSFNIEKILIAGSKMLENPLHVVNSTLQTLFILSISNGENGDFHVSVSHTSDPVINIEPVKDALRNERIIKEPYFTSVTSNGKQSYCSNLFLFNRFVGCISMSESHRPFRSSDLAVADHFFALFQSAFGKHIRNSLITLPPKVLALKNLLNHLPLGESDATLLSLEEDESWICFLLAQQAAKSTMPTESMSATLNEIMPNTVITSVWNSEIIGLFKVVAGDKNKDDLKYFEDFIGRMGFVAGFSNSFQKSQDTEIYLKFARYSLEMGVTEKKTSRVFLFDKYIIDYIITRYTGDFSPEHFYPKGLHALLDHDSISHVSYIETLSIYLATSMSIAETAKALFLHRSSVVSRLDKIKKHLSMDLNDPKDRLYILLCLQLLKKEI